MKSFAKPEPHASHHFEVVKEGVAMEKSMRDLNETIKGGQGQLDKILEEWPKKPRGAAYRLKERYGDPDEFSVSQLIWYNTSDGWKRTVLMKEEIAHNFPSHHTDFLDQSINYKVPVHLFSRLAEFNGSVKAERTRGELSARCSGTSMNFVAINLAHDIIIGSRSVLEAREEYMRLYKAFQESEIEPYASDFQFELPKGSTGDLDVNTL